MTFWRSPWAPKTLGVIVRRNPDKEFGRASRYIITQIDEEGNPLHTPWEGSAESSVGKFVTFLRLGSYCARREENVRRYEFYPFRYDVIAIYEEEHTT